jgi:hypothetical protein
MMKIRKFNRKERKGRKKSRRNPNVGADHDPPGGVAAVLAVLTGGGK